MQLTEQYLVESQSLRNEGLEKFKVQRSEKSILHKVKSLFFALWKDKERVTRQQVADFYEVSVNTIDTNYGRYKDEFQLDGVEVLRGNDLKEVRLIMSLTSSTPKEAVYTPAGVLRMGFILRDSPVAKQVRTTAIRFIQGIGENVSSGIVLSHLSARYPVLSGIRNGSSLRVSAPYADCWQLVKQDISRNYSASGIDGMSVEEIRRKIQLCSTYTDSFKLQGIKEIRRNIGGQLRAQYPDLTSDVIGFEIAGELGSSVFMFEISNKVVTLQDVQEKVGRDYIRTAINDLKVDKAYLIFLSPFGADPAARDFIQNHIRPDYQGLVGVLTIKEFADLLHSQAWSLHQLGVNKGKISTEFAELRNYKLPDIPDLYQQLTLFEN